MGGEAELSNVEKIALTNDTVLYFFVFIINLNVTHCVVIVI